MTKIEFVFEINRNKVILIQIYEKIKDNILSGIYKYGDKLPSIRKASEILGVSKSSIIDAYFQLCTEGYIENIPYKGYYICKISSIKKYFSDTYFDYKQDNVIYINDAIDKNALPTEIWKKNYAKVLQDDNLDLTTLGDEQGEYELREAIADFIRTHRGCNVIQSQIIIASGIQSLLSLLIKITNYKFAFLEDPGYKKAQYIFEDYNVDFKKIPVYENGIELKDLENKKNSLIYVSPSYQYPMGSLMPIDKRLDLINYANENNCLIVEDDYASIIRYDSKPISALQGLDIYDNTIYLGSFSKTFSPSMRISFMVLPKKLLNKYYQIKNKYTHSCSKTEQLTLARIISNGNMEKHLRKINNIYKQKNQLITKYIKENYGDKLIVKSSQSGFHLILSCKTSRNLDFTEDFKDEFLLLDVIEFKDNNLLFSFSYSGLDNDEIPNVIDKIAKILLIDEISF
ncbi:MAG: PLP-dependent aminotransferase family protein [Clostridia bacterium]